jgi:iron complex outermembrane recepter protein
MLMRGGRLGRLLGLRTVVMPALAAAAVLTAPPAQAQTQLPGVVVETPSPVRKKTPRPPAPPAASGTASPEEPSPPPEPIAGTSLNISPDDTFSAVTILTPTELLGQPYATLGDALGSKPGIAATSFAPGASRPVIRGLSGFRVSTQENGLSTGDVAALSDDHAIPIDPNAAGQVEVVRGPATLRYGSQAIGGVVNAMNNRIPDALPPAGFRVETRGGLSSVDDGRDGSMMVEAGAGHFAVHADAFKRTADDYRIPEPPGRQLNTSLDSEGYSLGGSYIGRNGFVGIAYTSFASTYFIPGIEAAADKNHIALDQTKWTSKGEWRVNDYGLEAIRFWLGATDYKHSEIDGLGASSVIGSTFLNKQYEARVEAQHLPVKTALGVLTGAAGVQWLNRDLQAGGGADGVLLAPTSTVNLAGFVFEELQLAKKLRFQAAARIETSDVKGTASTFPPDFLPPPADPTETPASSTITPKSGSLGLLYDLPLGVIARLTAQHVERAPDATELYYRGPHDSTATFEIGNPNLTIEGANTFEIGFKRAKGDFRFDVSAYHTSFKNFIYKRFTGAKCDDDFASCGSGTELDQIVYSQRDATFTGAEVLAEYDVSRLWGGLWGIEGRYDFVHAKFDDGTYVPKIPPQRLGGGVYWRDANWLARVNLLHAFAQHEFATFDTPTPGYNLLNAELSYTLKQSQMAGSATETTIGLRAENLLDDDVRNSVSYKKDEVLQPGRNFRLFGSVKLN